MFLNLLLISAIFQLAFAASFIRGPNYPNGGGNNLNANSNRNNRFNQPQPYQYRPRAPTDGFRTPKQQPKKKNARKMKNDESMDNSNNQMVDKIIVPPSEYITRYPIQSFPAEIVPSTLNLPTVVDFTKSGKGNGNSWWFNQDQSYNLAMVEAAQYAHID